MPALKPASHHIQEIFMLARELVGNGPRKVVVMHCWLSDHTMFASMMPHLDTEEFTYAFVDFNGYGRSSSAPLPATIEDMGKGVFALTDSLGWQNFYILGHSMGGMAAQWMAATRPEKVRALALLTPVPARGFPMDEATAGFFGAAAGSDSVRAQVSATVTADRYSDASINYMVSLSHQGSPETIARYLDIWQNGDVSEYVTGKYQGPVRALVGEFDPVITKALMEVTVGKYFPQASIKTVHGGAHYPPLEVPALTASLVEEFFLE
jgi:pimeloyl-ACP methyl ester carboxylesterase